jgi:hypothetical protein
LDNAKKALQIPANEKILILLDDTVFGSAKDAVAITTWGVRYNILKTSWSLSWKNLYMYNFKIMSDKHLSLLTSAGLENKYSARYEMVLYVARIDGDTLFLLCQTASLLFGSDMEINSLSQLIDKLKEYFANENAKSSDVEHTENSSSANINFIEKLKVDENTNVKPETSDKGDVKKRTIKNTEDELIQETKKSIISDQITVVYDRKDNNAPMAGILVDLIKQISSAEPQLKTKAEYEASLFEDELLDQVSNKYVVFVGKLFSNAFKNISWKYDECGMKYGWIKNQAVLCVDTNFSFDDDDIKVLENLLRKYTTKSLYELLSKVFLAKGMDNFLMER